MAVRLSVIVSLCSCIWSVESQRELIASKEADHACWRPLTTVNGDNPGEENAYYAFVSDDDKTCYYLSTKPATFPQAEETCTSLATDSHLYSDASWEENQFYTTTVVPSCDKRQVGSPGCSVWLGLQWDGTCSWKDGSKFSFFKWPRTVSDQCTEPYSSRYCASIDRTGSWDVNLCLKEVLVLCEWRIVLPPSEAAALSRANTAKAVGLFFLIVLLLLLLLLIIFLLLGRFYLGPKIRDAVNFGLRGNAPDVHENIEAPAKSDDEQEQDELFMESEGSRHEMDNYETIPIRGPAKDEAEPREKPPLEEETPLLEDPKQAPTEAPGSPPVVVEPPVYATPVKPKKKPEQQPDWDEITVMDNDLYE